jgi:hypothetical protein
MASEWIAGIFGAIGAIVGAGATLAASWIPTRAQQQLAIDKQEERKAKVRRAASSAYLVSVDSFIDSARELVYRIEHDASELDREAAHEIYLQGWQRVQRTCAPVEIAGTSDLSAKANELKLHLGSLGNLCDRWYEAAKRGPTRSQTTKFEASWESADNAREEFTSAARQYAYQQLKAGK